MKIRHGIALFLVLGSLGIAACGGSAPQPPPVTQAEPPPAAANPVVDDASWNTKWTVQNSGKDPVFQASFEGAEEYPAAGKTGILMVHPLNETTPCVMTRRFKVAEQGGASLLFSVAGNSAQPTADFKLVVKVDGTSVKEQVVAGKDGWTDVNVDLSAFAGKEITVEIVAASGGAKAWEWEHCFLSAMRKSGLEDAVAVSVSDENWHKKWTVTNSGKEVVCLNDFAGLEDFPHPGRAWVLVLHPQSEQVPCVMTREVAVPASSSPVLVLSASADANDGAIAGKADSLLRVRINGEQKLQDVVRTGAQKAASNWKDYRIDLSPYAGKTVKIEIEAASGGDNPWAWEYLFLADVRVQGVD